MISSILTLVDDISDIKFIISDQDNMPQAMGKGLIEGKGSCLQAREVDSRSRVPVDIILTPSMSTSLCVSL